MNQRFCSILFVLFIFSCKNDNNQSRQFINTKLKKAAESPITVIKPCSNLLLFDGLKGRVKSMTKTTFHAQNKRGVMKKVALGNIYITRYDSIGNGVERLYYNSENKLQTHTKYQLDQTKKCVKAIVYNHSRVAVKQLEFKYDQKLNLIQEISLSREGKLVSKQVYQYNKFAQVEAETKYDQSNRFDIKTTYAFDKKGYPTNTKFYRPENKLIIECNTSFSNFDIKGNWLTCIERTNKGSNFIVERKIEYH